MVLFSSSKNNPNFNQTNSWAALLCLILQSPFSGRVNDQLTETFSVSPNHHETFLVSQNHPTSQHHNRNWLFIPDKDAPTTFWWWWWLLFYIALFSALKQTHCALMWFVFLLSPSEMMVRFLGISHTHMHVLMSCPKLVTQSTRCKTNRNFWCYVCTVLHLQLCKQYRSIPRHHNSNADLLQRFIHKFWNNAAVQLVWHDVHHSYIYMSVSYG